MQGFFSKYGTWIFGGSMAALIVGILLGPYVLLRLPEDYFSEDADDEAGAHIVIWALRNLLGALLVFAGVLMLVLPGQGILTIIAGLVVMRFPAKRRLFRLIYQRKQVRDSLNWLRRKCGRPPFSD